MRVVVAVGLLALLLSGCTGSHSGQQGTDVVGFPSETSSTGATNSAPSSASEPPASPNGTTTPGTTAPMTCRATPDDSTNSHTMILRNESAFAPWYAAHCAWSGSAEPKVDFSNAMVLAYFWGQKPSGGYVVSLGPYDVGSGGTVTVTRTSPGPSCATTSVITYPMGAAVVAPKRDLVTFWVNNAVHECMP